MSMGGGGGGGAQDTTSEVVLPEWAQQQAQQNLAQANQLASQPYTPYPGQTVAGFNPDELATFSGVEGLQGSTDAGYGQALNSVTNLPSSINSLLSPYLPGAEAAVTQQAERTGALSREQLQSNAIGAGALGGTREGVAEAMNDSTTQQNIASAVNQLATTGYNTAASNVLGQASTLGQLTSGQEQAALTGLGALGAVGQQEQGFTQAQYSDALSQWQQQQSYPYQQLAIEQSVLQGTPYGSTTTGSQPYTSNPALQYAGLGLAAIPAGVSAYNLLAGSGSAAAASAAAADAAATSGAAAAGAGGASKGAAAAAPALLAA